jgi:TP901 family phage tail tape measure protein
MARKAKLEVEIVGDSSSVERAFGRTSAAGRKFNAQITGLSRGLSRGLGFAAAAGGVVVFTRALTGSVKAAGDFQLALQKMVGLSGVAQKSIQGLRDDVLKLAPIVGKGPQELADALFFITSSGIPAAKALDVLTVSAKASAAGLGDTATVADAVTSALNAYGPAVLSATQATDVLVATVREGKGEADQFAGVIGNVAALAAQLGVSFDQVGAALAAQTRLGTDAETSATQLQRVFSTLLKVTPKSAKAFESVGLSAAQLRADLGKQNGLLNVLEQVRVAFAKNPAALAEAFGDIRGLRGVLALVGKQAEATRGIFNRLSQSTGSLGTAFGAVSRTQAQQFAQLSASLEVFKITIGAALAPAIKDILGPLTKWLAQTKNQKRVQRELTQTVQDAVGAVRGFVDAVKPMVEVAKNAADQIGGMRKAVQLLIVAFTVSKLVSFAAGITGIGVQAATATGRVNTLRIALTRLAAIGLITVGVELVLNRKEIEKNSEDFLRSHGLGFLTSQKLEIPFKLNVQNLPKLQKIRDEIAGLKGEGDLAVKALDKIITRISRLARVGESKRVKPGVGRGKQASRASSDAASNDAAEVAAAEALADKRRKAAVAVRKAAAAAAKAKQEAIDAFGLLFDSLSLGLEAAQATKGFKDDLRALAKQEAAIRDEIKVEGRTTELLRQLFQVRQQRQDVQRQQAEAQRARRQGRQFSVLGLTEEGGQRTPSTAALKKRLGTLREQINGTVLDTSKTQSQLTRIAKVLSGKFGKVGKDVRAAILQMFKDIAGALSDGSDVQKGPLTKFVKQGSEKILAGLGLSPEQVKALRQRLAQIGPGGTAPNKGFGAFGMTFAPGGAAPPIIVESHIFLDGRELETSVTRRQQKTKGRTASSRRGTNPGTHH